MGEVYKARDGRLDRIVTVKVSKAEFTERFTREARTLAQLNHPNVCTLFDVGPNYLVMDFVEGTPLQGPLPVEKALEYAGHVKLLDLDWPSSPLCLRRGLLRATNTTTRSQTADARSEK